MTEKLNEAIRGLRPFDLVIANAQVVNVYTEEILPMDIGITDGMIGYVVPTDKEDLQGIETIDAKEAYVIPGLIDCHVHIESSMLNPINFARAALPHGTTTVVIDPHEIANVLGKRAVEYMIQSRRDLPLDILVEIPSSVPAVPGMETAGATFLSHDIEEMLSKDGVVGLAEVMDFPGVINRSQRMVDILKVARKKNTIISGHAPLVSGRDLAAYLAEGPNSDHEVTELDEMVEKIRAGMIIEARCCSLSENVSLLVEALNRFQVLPPNVVFCTDDVLPNDLVKKGHMNEVVRKAISCGMSPERAIRIATLHGAQRFRLWDRGAIAPGQRGDFCLVRDLHQLNPHMVFSKGQLVAQQGRVIIEIPQKIHPVEEENTVQLKEVSRDDFNIPVSSGEERVIVHGMLVSKRSLITEYKAQELPVVNGVVDFSSEEDLTLAILLERHGKNGNIGKTVIEGLGLKTGAVATTVAHDSHNLLVVGKSSEDMFIAVKKLQESRGGVVYVNRGQIQAIVELPVGGLMSILPAEEMALVLSQLQNQLKNAGIGNDDPLMAIVMLALPVIPEVRLTDRGLLNVVEQELYPAIN